MAKIVVDNLQYARVILKMGTRENAATTDLVDVVDEDTAAQVRDAAIHSMGVGVWIAIFFYLCFQLLPQLTPEDITNIKMLCEEVVSTSEYRVQLFEYLRNRMNAIAPNLTTMVGELVGARLISHAGVSLKGPAMPPPPNPNPKAHQIFGISCRNHTLASGPPPQGESAAQLGGDGWK